MAIGYTVSMASINNTAGDLTNQWQQLAAVTQAFYQSVSVTLGVAGLETAGFSAGDATAMKAISDYLGTLAGVYYGTVQQGGNGGTGAILFNFDSALTPARGIGGRPG